MLNNNSIEVQDWGQIAYTQALTQQMNILQQVLDGTQKEVLICCSHPPVVTLGRQARREDVGLWSGEVEEVARGGKATYHGPGQLVVYPILQISRRNNDLSRYLRSLEGAMIATLSIWGLQAQAPGSRPTGVWVGEKKVASIGIAVKRWVTYHGLAINLEKDPLAFFGINPCGLAQDTMMSVEELLGHKVDRGKFQQQLISFLQEFLNCT